MKKNILVADDDPAIVDAITLILEDEGYSVQTTDDGKMLLRDSNLPDVILLDIWLSGSNGGQVCEVLKQQEQTKKVPIILISANPDVASIAHECHADGYLRKPFDIGELLNTVKRVTKTK